MTDSVAVFSLYVGAGVLVICAVSFGLIVLGELVVPDLRARSRAVVRQLSDRCAVQSRPVVVAVVATLLFALVELGSCALLLGRIRLLYWSLIPGIAACILVWAWMTSRMRRQFEPVFRGNHLIWPGKISRDRRALRYLLPVMLACGGTAVYCFVSGLTARSAEGVGAALSTWLLLLPPVGLAASVSAVARAPEEQADLTGGVVIEIAHTRLRGALVVVELILAMLLGVTAWLGTDPGAVQAWFGDMLWNLVSVGATVGGWWAALTGLQQLCFMYLVTVSLPVVSTAAVAIAMHVSLRRTGERGITEARQINDKVRTHLAHLERLGITRGDLRLVATMYGAVPEINLVIGLLPDDVQARCRQFVIDVAAADEYVQMVDEMVRERVEVRVICGDAPTEDYQTFSLKSVLQACRDWAGQMAVAQQLAAEDAGSV